MNPAGAGTTRPEAAATYLMYDDTDSIVHVAAAAQHQLHPSQDTIASSCTLLQREIAIDWVVTASIGVKLSN